MRWLKARLQNRRGAPPWQPYFELAKLFGKEVVMSSNASWLFRCAPYIVFASTLAVTFLMPLLAAPLPFDGVGDLLVVVYLLAAGNILPRAGRAGSGYGFRRDGRQPRDDRGRHRRADDRPGHLRPGAGGGFDQSGPHRHRRRWRNPATAISPGHLLAFAALFIVTLAETGRLPVDNPATHLELTMIHEAMILEYSGRYLALIEWAAWLKLTDLPFPAGQPVCAVGRGNRSHAGRAGCGRRRAPAKAWVAWPVVIAVVETRVAKLRLFRVPELLGVSFVLALLAVTSSFL